MLSLGFTVITATFVALEYFVISPILQYFILFYGVFFGYYAVRDIWDDTVARDTEESDAEMCTRSFPMCRPAKCVGVQFLIMAIIFQFAGFYLALVWMITYY